MSRKKKSVMEPVLKNFEFAVEYKKDEKWKKVQKKFYEGIHYHDAWFNCVAEIQDKYGKYPVRNTLS